MYTSSRGNYRFGDDDDDDVDDDDGPPSFIRNRRYSRSRRRWLAMAACSSLRAYVLHSNGMTLNAFTQIIITLYTYYYRVLYTLEITLIVHRPVFQWQSIRRMQYLTLWHSACVWIFFRVQFKTQYMFVWSFYEIKIFHCIYMRDFFKFLIFSNSHHNLLVRHRSGKRV